jgi:hypothetical protein
MLRKKNKTSIKQEIYSVPIPPNWREGQFVFNRAEELYGVVARNVQYIDKVDCYFHDDVIDAFLERVCVWLNKKNKK